MAVLPLNSICIFARDLPAGAPALGAASLYFTFTTIW
jgi:hypothetical protein